MFGHFGLSLHKHAIVRLEHIDQRNQKCKVYWRSVRWTRIYDKRKGLAKYNASTNWRKENEYISAKEVNIETMESIIARQQRDAATEKEREKKQKRTKKSRRD